MSAATGAVMFSAVADCIVAKAQLLYVKGLCATAETIEFRDAAQRAVDRLELHLAAVEACNPLMLPTVQN